MEEDLHLLPASKNNFVFAYQLIKYILSIIFMCAAVFILVYGIFFVVINALNYCAPVKRYSANVQNIRQLGIALLANASAADEQNFPAMRDDKNTTSTTSTEVFRYLIQTKEIPTSDLVFAPGKNKVKCGYAEDLKSNNVGYNYIKVKKNSVESGVAMSADQNLPLLWDSGHTPLAVKPGGDLQLKDTGIFGTTGCTVYYKGNNATFIKSNGKGLAESFISDSYHADHDTVYIELAP